MKNSNRAALSIAVLLFFFSNCYAGQQISASQQPITVKFMTFNVQASNLLDFLHRWSSRKELVFKVIADHNPDVLGLQEPLHDQVIDVQQAFPQYAYYSAGASDGKNQGQSCPIFYRNDRFDLISSGTFWFSDRPDKPGAKGWGNLIPRFCSWVQLREKGKNNSFYVYNTHLDSLSQSSRNKSVRLLKKQVASRTGSAPFIIIGDFNMLRTNRAMALLLERDAQNQFPLIDAWASIYPQGPDATTYEPKGRQIDHILMGFETKAINVRVDNRKLNGRYSSDHFPVIADIAFPAISLDN